MFRLTTLRARLTAAFLGLAILPLFVAALLIGGVDSTYHMRESWQHQLSRARRVAVEVRAFFGEAENTLLSANRYVTFTRLEREQQYNRLSHLVFEGSLFREASYIDQTGREVIKVSRVGIVEPDALRDLGRSPLFRAPFDKGTAFFGEVRFAERTGTPVMAVSVPLRDPETGAVAGVLAAELRLTAVWDLIARNTGEQGISVYLLDEDGLVIAHRNPTLVLRRTRLSFTPTSRIQEGVDHARSLLAEAPLIVGGQHLRVVAEQEATRVLGMALAGLAGFGLTLIAASLLATVISVVTVRRILHPVESITEAARRIGDGALDVQVEVADSGEVADMARAFNTMTERLRETIDARQRERDLLQSIIDTVPDLIFVKDENLRFIICNQAFEARVGRSRAEMSGKRSLDVLPRDEAERYERTDREVLESGRMVEIEDTAILPDGQEAYFDIIKLPFHTRKGERLGMIGVARNITDRRRAEQALSNLTHRLELLLASAGEGIFGVDTEGRNTFANPAALEMFGYTAGELVGRSHHAIVHHSRSDGTPYAADSCPVRRAFAQGQVSHVTDEVFWRKDGTCFPVEYLATPLEEDGRISGAVVVFHDIGERRRAERELAERTRDLQRSNADLQQFAYAASHDLREPLRMVTAYLELLSRRYGDVLDDQGREFVRFAVDGAVRMDGLIRDLLDYSRVQTAGKAPQRFDSSEALRAALANLAVPIAESGATVTCGDMPTVLADRPQIARVFQNLIANAIRYRDPDRPLEISVSATRRGNDWEFAIRDNGEGIAPEHRERIFHIFQRLHSNRHSDGTGMGLALCKRIIDRHGGTIWVDSEPGSGSTFRFTLPEG